MARKPAPAKAHAEADATQSPTRRMQLPWWLRSNGLPRHVADPVEQVLQQGNFPAPLANLWAMVNLARAAEGGILTVRRDHGAKPDSMDPAVFVQNVIFRLRSARDELLKQTSAAHVAIVNARLDAFIGATKATLGAFMADDLDKIWCDNPTCGNRGKHLLPGPWIDAMARSREASEEASRLAVFVGGDAPAPTPAPGGAGDKGNTATKALPTRTEVVLWEGAEHNERNVRLARIRSAYLEAHGKVSEALAALEADGHRVGRSTFYNHLDALDKAIPRWRASVQLSNSTGNLDGMRYVRPRGKSRGKVR